MLVRPFCFLCVPVLCCCLACDTMHAYIHTSHTHTHTHTHTPQYFKFLYKIWSWLHGSFRWFKQMPIYSFQFRIHDRNITISIGTNLAKKKRFVNPPPKKGGIWGRRSKANCLCKSYSNAVSYDITMCIIISFFMVQRQLGRGSHTTRLHRANANAV
jgi:hypothetical protein